MRLLRFHDDDSLSLVEFLGNDIPPFAILSHTWYSDSEEYNFQDVIRGTGKEKRGYEKVQFCGQQTERDGLQYFWVDTCCIDKSSSTELTEAINSMFRWYQNSEKCYVYLSDVMCYSNGPDDGTSRWKPAFRDSRWFTRGWTLQELIAPRSVSFFSQEEQVLGDKCSLLETLHEITGITFKALQGDSLSEFGVEERFAWAANRHTKREEDAAYSLLGIFSVHLPLIYGEGKDNAFARLRREISGVPLDTNMEKEERAKIFAWLSAPDPSTNYDKAFKQRLKGTGLWFLEGQEFAKWKLEESSLLWLHGIPGSGKTILSSAIIQDILEDQSVYASIKAYFFFDFKDTQKQDPDDMLRSLLFQMSQQCESMYTSLHTLYKSCKDGQHQPSADALMRTIQRGMDKHRQAYIVLDALDECSQRMELMQTITTMIEWRFTGWHFLMTSRKEREIENYLEGLLDCKNTLSLKSHLVNHDIRHYVQKRLSEDKALQKWAKDQSIREEIEEALMKGAQGMFRWALCQLDTLGACRNIFMLRRALKTLPPTLDATYDRILNAISDEDYTYAIRILRWLTYSRRPLTVKELATLIAIDVDSTPAFDPDQVFPDPLEVLDICSSLVSIRDTSIVARNSSGYDSVLIEGRDLSAEVVELAHYSVKEYLTSERLANLPSARYRMEAAECEAILASSCLLYLLRWERNMGRDARERVLADYPVWYWMTHMYRSDPRPEELNHLAARLLMADTPAYQEWLSTKTPLLHAIIYGLAKVVQIILERGDTIEQTAFKDALYFKRREIAFLLVEHNATLDNCLYMIRKWEDKELETAWRNKQRETVLALIKSGAESDRALSTACELDDEELAAVLIHPNLSIQLQGSELEKACVAGHAGIVRLLLQNGPEVANPIVKAQALRAAYLNKNWAIFEELLRFDAEFNSCDDDPEAYRYDSRGIHLTSIQLEEHDEEFARFLQRYSTPKSTIDRFYTKLLYRASLDGNTGLVATLVEKGVDVNVQGRAHGNALRAAIGRGHKDVVKILREAGAYAWKPGH